MTEKEEEKKIDWATVDWMIKEQYKDPPEYVDPLDLIEEW